MVSMRSIVQKMVEVFQHFVWRQTDARHKADFDTALFEPIEHKEVENSRRVKECSVRDAPAFLVGGEIEVETTVGSIDVLSGNEVIDVKYYKQWKHGLGQALANGSFFPLLAKLLHLFAHNGEVGTRKYFELARSGCDTFSARVTFEEVPDSDDGPPGVKGARGENDLQHERKRRQE